MKYVCLGVLVLQTCANVLTLRYSRSHNEEGAKVYIPSTAVFMAEVLKMCLCALMILHEARYPHFEY